MSKLTAAFAHARALELVEADSYDSNIESDPVNVQPFEGLALAVLAVSDPVAGTNPAIEVSLEHADTADGDYTPVPGGGFVEVTSAGGVQVKALNAMSLKPFVRAVSELGGTSSPEYTVSLVLLGVDKYRP